jgi:purine-binding chemotaxis protein CheW
MNTSSSAPDAGRRELIAFCLGEQEFCIAITDVREIRSWAPATPVPGAPDYVRGVINLRGAVLPVIDLGARLGLAAADPTARHAIVVVQARGQTVGLLVDSVSDIITVSAADIQPPPEAAGHGTRLMVRGLLAVDGRLISLVAADDLLPESLPPGLAAVA